MLGVLGFTAVALLGLCVLGGVLTLLFGLGGQAAAIPEPPRSVCAQAADCCIEIAGVDGSGAASCESIRTLEPYGGDGCANALANYRESLARMGRDPSVCD